MKVAGDISKLPYIIGLTETEKALLRNYFFMSSRIPGTRQIRNSIRHIVFSSRVFYGVPSFVSFTPSERHSGLAIHLSRGRRSDPAFSGPAQSFTQWIGYNAPSLQPEEQEQEDSSRVVVDLPEYDIRRLMTARDPLCCVYAFQVCTRVVLPSMYGFRMCPDCPHCATSEQPCMDSFGSNATPMGGAAGRGDGMVAAVEAQKSEGALHIHAFIYFQNACQYATLHELGTMLREGFLSVEAFKQWNSYVRCASYPDLEQFQKERGHIENTWPAYAADQTLSRIPTFFWSSREATGLVWKAEYMKRLQHCMSRMNHHIHPLVNAETGERHSLPSCRPKGKHKSTDICKGDFPLTNQITQKSLLVCECIAEERQLPTRGPRSMLGAVLP